MFLYKFGYGSCEESRYCEVIHEEEYSDEEFKKIVFNAIVRVFRGIINGNYDVYIHTDGISYEEIHYYVVEEMKAVGFKEVEYQAKWSCFGWPGITETDSWGEQRGEDLNELSEFIPQDIKDVIETKIKERNIREEKELADWVAKKKDEGNGEI